MELKRNERKNVVFGSFDLDKLKKRFSDVISFFWRIFLLLLFVICSWVKVVSIFITIEQNVIYVNYIVCVTCCFVYLCKGWHLVFGKLKIYKIYL